jgi:hypothetical protein
MKNPSKHWFVFAVVFITGLITTSAAEVCLKLNATGKGQITGQTATNATTVSEVIGGGVLHGTTTAELTFTGIDPVTGVATYEGTLVLTNRHGTVNVSFSDGSFNLVTGEFENDSTITGGTGRFAGATGDIYFHGFVAADGSFIDDAIDGTICLEVP